MPALAQHIVLSSRDRCVIARSPAERRLLARTIIRRSAAGGLLAFRAADTHIHMQSSSSRSAAGRLARAVEIALTRALGLANGFAPAHFEPIHDQRHLQNVFFYVLRQEQRHGLQSDPFHEASNLPDLLGLRAIGDDSARRVRALLPRVRRSQLLELLGVSSLDQPVELTLFGLREAASAAAALPGLSGHARWVRDVRCAAIAVAGDSFRAAQLAEALQTSKRSVVRLRGRRPDPALVRAVELQFRLRAARRGPRATR